MDVGEWLRSLGVGQYEAAFRENEIDGEILPKLTAEDLKELGVAVVGHRRKLLTAIADLHASAAAPALVDPPPSTSPPQAERRQLTVMFCDLVGSTALSARLDPEDLRDVIGAYHRCVAECVERHGGFVAKYMGDGVLVYFGYPQAHEHDAERAVRAGLAIVEAAPRLKTVATSPLQVRIGIATGPVIVGDLLGAGAAQEQAVVGETPNLAARLQASAEPDMVVIADSTRRLLGNLFELQDLGARDLKGIAGPARVWRALRPSSAESRFEALHATGLTALVGREEEFELLLRRWLNAKSGDGQVVLLSGEAGIGKSRLTAALLERLADQPHTRLRYFCSPQHTDSALYPIKAQLERAAGLTREHSPEAKLDKLDSLLEQSATSSQDAGLLAAMLSLPNNGRYQVLDVAPQQRRQKTLEALFYQTEALARRNPVLMIFEDAHWADPTSLEMLGRLMDKVPTLPILMVVTYRPEFNPPWGERPCVTALAVNRLARRELIAMIDRVVGDKPLPSHIRNDIIERSDGVPLFAEEMTKAVLESESQSRTGRTSRPIPSPAVEVPASLHASLTARLDRLGHAKDVAQICAAIGRDISYAILASVAPLAQPELDLALRRLVDAGLLSQEGAPQHANYLFKHALVRDAAYGMLLRGARQDLHCRIVSVLEREFPDLVASQPELMARHCGEAGMIAEAIEYYLSASRIATAAFNNVEASAHLARGVGLLDRIEATDPRRVPLYQRLAYGGWFWTS